ncbi:hypothetical protein [Streptomyces sp. NPDC021139]|uniref:hypothetical protein n=1 Tax=unclassified Streptomyces TaxID=2593676 RepID=UPI0033C9D9E2
MSEPTPSQAEGERDDEPDTPDVPHTTPSQAEGEREDDVENVENLKEEPEGR